MKGQFDISVVIPLYDEEGSLPELHQRIVKVMEANDFSYEILFINDGSKDNSWEIIQKLALENQHVKGFSFNRNYGKSAALQIGFERVKGSVVITMDADLQDFPEEIPELYKMIVEDGNDLVSGWKQERKDPLTKTIPTKLFNFVTSHSSGIHTLHDFNCGLKAYRLEVVKSVDVYGEMHRYIPVLAKWNGYEKIVEKPVRHVARKYGKTKFGMERFINGFLDFLSVSFITRFRKRPMHFFGTLGLISFIMGFLMTVWVLFEKQYKLYNEIEPLREIVDQPFFFLALVLLIIGSQFFLAGFIGEMIVIHSNKRNDYLISDEVNT
jgi:glycosyltransferase involved in cell wall biosynthesis